MFLYSRIAPYLLALGGGSSIGLAWLLPSSMSAAVLGWISAIALLTSVRIAKCPYRCAYISGVTANSIGFYWLLGTIALFGGFSIIPATLVFLLFVLLSSLQFVVFVFIFKNLPKIVDLIAIRASVAWVLSEFLPFRIFPWQYAHTQLSFTSFIQVADIAGTLLISFILFAVADAFVRYFFLHERHKMLFTPVLILISSISYGQARYLIFNSPEGEPQSIGIVQGNIALDQKHSVEVYQKNVDHYIELSREI
ncbi:MAG: hypothetical protein KDD53_09300, partial [Bdellovibrionales bacterium]|nr:hypothetical protein [Bdellovibrionales bacterium]